MNFPLKNYFVFIVLFISNFTPFLLNTQEENLNEYIKNYDKTNLLIEYNTIVEKLKNDKNNEKYNFRAGRICYYLSNFSELDFDENSKKKYAELAEGFLNKAVNLNPDSVESWTYLALVYYSLIKGPKEFMQYNDKMVKARKKAEEIDKDNPLFKYYQTKILILWPDNMGGNPELGLENTEKLIEEKHDLFELDHLRILALKELERHEEMEEKLVKLLAEKPYLKRSRQLLTKIKVERNQPRINKISYLNPFKTNNALVRKCISFKEDEIFTMKTLEKTRKKLEIFPYVELNLAYDYDETENQVDIGIVINETKLEVIGFTTSFQLTAGDSRTFVYEFDFENDYPFPPYPIIIYLNNNLFNLNIDLDLMTAFIFWNIQISRKNLIFAFLDYKIGVNTMMIPNLITAKTYNLDRVAENKYSYNNNWVTAWTKIGKNFFFGVDIWGTYEFHKNFYFRNPDTDDDFRLPDNMNEEQTLDNKIPLIKHSGFFDMGYSSVDFVDKGRYIPKGFLLQFGIKYEHYQNFRDWGIKEDGEYQYKPPENGWGTLKYYLTAGYYLHFARILNIKLDGHYYGGNNFYDRLNLYSFGSSQFPQRLVIHGYREGEFKAEHIIAANFSFGIEPVKNIFHFELLYDVALLNNYRLSKYDHGFFWPLHSTGIKTHIGLPFDIRLNIEYGVGFNNLKGEWIQAGHHNFTIGLMTLFFL